jgi:hypothetical protein
VINWQLITRYARHMLTHSQDVCSRAEAYLHSTSPKEQPHAPCIAGGCAGPSRVGQDGYAAIHGAQQPQHIAQT